MSLAIDLISHWKLDEASGDAVDSHGSNTLTETSGTIGTAAGKIGNARDFESGDTELFSRADNASLSTGNIDFTFSAWVNFESLAANGALISKWDLAGNVREYAVIFEAGFLKFLVSSAGTDTIAVSAVSLGAPSVGVWYFVVAWHDAGSSINIQVNNGAVDTLAHLTGVIDSTASFCLGSLNEFAGYYLDGLLDEVSFWKRVLTPAERTNLYNSGAGLAYPFTMPRKAFTGDFRNVGGLGMGLHI
jgi:hypothetical protein